MAGRIERVFGGPLAGKNVAVLGITFKPDTDDVRDAPSLTLVPMLQESGATVRAYDPHGARERRRLLPGVIWCGNALEAVDEADVVVVVTEWNEFRALDLDDGEAAHARRSPRRPSQHLCPATSTSGGLQLRQHRPLATRPSQRQTGAAAFCREGAGEVPVPLPHLPGFISAVAIAPKRRSTFRAFRRYS